MTVTAEPDWQRLHPLTVLKEMGGLAWAIVVALFLDFETFQVPGDWGVRSEVVVAVVVFAYATARYIFTAYRVTPTALEVRRGVFVKELQVMPRERVQSVGATTGFIGRIFGITTVEVSAADAEDIRLGFVSEGEAEALRRVLERHVSGGELETDDEDADAPRTTRLAALSSRGLFVYAITDVLFSLAVLVFVTGILVALLIGSFSVVLVSFPLAGWPLVRSVGLVGFRSWIDGDRIRMQAGIVGRRNSESPLDRIQLVQVRRTPLRRLAGKETIGMVTGDIGMSAESMALAGVLAPLEPMDGWRRVVEPVIGSIGIGQGTLEPSSRFSIRRTVVRGLVGLAVPVAAWLVIAAIFELPWLPAAVLGVVGAAAIIAYAVRRWRVLGWDVDEHHLMVRRGVFDWRLTIVPVHKVQDVTVRSSFFQHRLGIATVEVDTAGVLLSGRVLAVDLPVDRADYLARRLADAAAHVTLPDGV